jgi:hypothetical protein
MWDQIRYHNTVRSLIENAFFRNWIFMNPQLLDRGSDKLYIMVLLPLSVVVSHSHVWLSPILKYRQHWCHQRCSHSDMPQSARLTFRIWTTRPGLFSLLKTRYVESSDVFRMNSIKLGRSDRRTMRQTGMCELLQSHIKDPASGHSDPLDIRHFGKKASRATDFHPAYLPERSKPVRKNIRPI